MREHNTVSLFLFYIKQIHVVMYSVVQQMFHSRFPLSRLLKIFLPLLSLWTWALGKERKKILLLELRTLFLWINKLRVFVSIITHWKEKEKKKSKEGNKITFVILSLGKLTNATKGIVRSLHRRGPWKASCTPVSGSTPMYFYTGSINWSFWVYDIILNLQEMSEAKPKYHQNKQLNNTWIRMIPIYMKKGYKDSTLDKELQPTKE